MRSFSAITALVLLLGGEAAAQKKDYICGPNGIQQCTQACAARGGQARHCPQWCANERKNRCR
jgi:hypothetical protein